MKSIMQSLQEDLAMRIKTRRILSRQLVPITNRKDPPTSVYKLFSKLSFRWRRFAHTEYANTSNTIVLQWLQIECPQDLVLKIIAWAGPQTASSLAKTNRYWKGVMDEEETWRALCEELYKVSAIQLIITSHLCDAL